LAVPFDDPEYIAADRHVFERVDRNGTLLPTSGTSITGLLRTWPVAAA
jgi:hypothetical protein